MGAKLKSGTDKQSRPLSVAGSSSHGFDSARRRGLILIGLLVAFTVVAYLPAIRGGFIWDDDDYVTKNRTLLDLHGLWRIWFQVGATPQYYPLVHTTFWLEHHLWGLNPLGYHTVNVLLHALGAILLGHVLSRLQIPGAWLAAAIFALHPVQVESAAWVTERKNVLSGVFYFAAALAYLRFAVLENAGNTVSIKRRWRWYVGALLLFVCALLSKTVTCSLPAALLLVFWWKKGRLNRTTVLPTLPFFGIGIASGLLTAWMEKHNVGAQGADWSLTFIERCLIAGRALWFYAAKLVWPVHLTFIYPRWNINTGLWWQWLFPLAVVAVLAGLWFARHRIGRGPLTAVLFFVGTLFPALGFVNVYPMRYSFVADHFQYLGSVGLIVLGAVAFNRWGRSAAWLLPAVLGVLTWQQATIYRDVEILWRDTLAKNPACGMAHNNLGLLLAERGKQDEAEIHYRKALEINPNHQEALNNLGLNFLKKGQLDEAMSYIQRALQIQPDYPEALNNLGNALLSKGRVEEAMEQFDKSLRLDSNKPEAWNNMGTALANQKRYTEAILYFEMAAQLEPDNADTGVNLGNALIEMGSLDEAVVRLSAALRLNPDNVKAQTDLARVLAMQGHYSEAMEHYGNAMRLNPKDASIHYNFGVVLGMAGRTKEAIEQYRLALECKSNYAEAHNNLGVALTFEGKENEAVTHYTEALRLKPDYAEAHNNFAYVLAKLGRRDEAIKHLTEALRLNPNYEQAKKQLRELGGQSPN